MLQKKNTQEVTASLADAKEISGDPVLAAEFSALGRIFTLNEDQITALKALSDGYAREAKRSEETCRSRLQTTSVHTSNLTVVPSARAFPTTLPPFSVSQH